MKSSQAEKIIEKIDLAITDIDNFSDLTELEKSYLAKFLVVFICGVYEEIIETIINERVERCQDPEISNYIKESLDKTFRNPDIGNIRGLMGKFSIAWKLEIDHLPQNVQTAIDNIVNDKNALAHGNDVSLTLQDTIQYYEDSRVLIKKIDEMLL